MDFLPYIFNGFMAPLEKTVLSSRRQKLVNSASGNILEIGAGTGANFNYYDTSKVDKLTVMDLKFNTLIKKHAFNDSFDINYLEGNVQNLPFEDNTFDCVVSSLLFCSVDDPEIALGEVYRVLKPGGKFFFIEHVLPSKPAFSKLAHNLNNTWKAIGKCNINRNTIDNIKGASFIVDEYETFGNDILVFIAGIGLKRI